MGTLKYFASLFLGAGIVFMSLWVLAIVAWIQGIVMIFHASIVLGIISLFFQVPYFVESVVYWVTGYDIALHIALALGIG